MSDYGFSSPSSSSSSSGMNGAQRAELMDQVKSQLLVATLQELLQVKLIVWYTRCRYPPVHVSHVLSGYDIAFIPMLFKPLLYSVI